jgi:endonuclease
MQETPTEVRLIPPGQKPDVVGEILGNDKEDSENTDGEPSFALEYQLRDFLASNLNIISICGKRLRVFVDATGRDGIEFPSAVDRSIS